MPDVPATVPIDSIKVGPRFRKVLGDLDGLKESIEAVGLIHPVVIDSGQELIARWRRLEACRQLGREAIPVHVIDTKNPTQVERDENAIRKDFLPSEAVAIARALEPAEREAAKGRIASGKPLRKLREGGRVTKRLGSVVGMGPRTLEKATAVVEAAKADPNRHGHLLEEMDRTGKVDGVHRKLKVARQAEKIRSEPPPLPRGPFRTIDEIKAADVAKLAETDAVLWLWTTNAHLPDAFGIIEAWGFEYKNLLTWAKSNFGLGNWLRNQTEHCLLATRGKPLVTMASTSTVLHAKNTGHSRKPDEFYTMVEATCPGSKVSLFAREERPGWAVFGDEV